MLDTRCLASRSALFASLLLAACASQQPAPVETRTAAPVTAEAAPVVARPGHYIVKRGDTLYSIAHQHGRSFRELADWNGISDPNVISAGQELRVVPPGEAAPTMAETSPGVESRPVPARAAIGGSAIVTTPVPAVASAPAVASGALKTEPKGGRVAYSEQAWKDLTQPAAATASAPVSIVAAPHADQSAAPEPRASTPVATGDGSWGWPSAGKVIGTFNDSSNKGIDIGGNIGDEVLAAGAGEVRYVGSSLRGYGNLVIIKHSNEYSSVYAHNQEILVKENQQVRKGQKIATLGKSDADRPKLHFEIRRQGKPVDPMKYLPSR
ncbi:MAG: peptidoglycan DD-metalloendopeptidase family protein [Candidatus Dactylopiibacterium sp.]|nr:peptidoglycan DD-metalloendopeptidase family protein [Candidatus Dactylopiibacterium sp.]